MKCLIVDISKSSRVWLGQIVKESGFEYDEAGSGAEGLTKLGDNTFDLVFISMYLSDMDGLHFASLLRAKEGIKRLPLVMITTQEDKQVLERAVSLGVTEIYSKKNPEQIKDFVNRFFLQHGITHRIQGHILYIEDSKAVALKIKMLLEPIGVTLEHYSNAEAALQAFHSKNNFDLVLTDVILDGPMSGLGLLREIRKVEGKKGRIPVLVMTSFNDEARRLELLLSGANDYVTKPPVESELIARVKNQIANKKQLDIIEEQYMRLQDMAMKDQLTGLYNRHFLMEVAPAKLSEAKRHGISVSLIMIDVDKFKSINDTYGHAAGDAVLKAVASTLKTNCREEDVVARIGGEEFVILLANCDETDASLKADRIRAKIEAQNPAGYHVTASFGAGEYLREITQDFNDLLQTTDKAMYQAKKTGRNKVVKVSEIELE